MKMSYINRMINCKIFVVFFKYCLLIFFLNLSNVICFLTLAAFLHICYSFTHVMSEKKLLANVCCYIVTGFK